MKLKLKTGQKVEVEWLDTVTHDESWFDVEDYPYDLLRDSSRMHTVGWVLTTKYGMLHLSMNKRSVNDRFSVVTAIPLGCVTKIRKLK
jgi:hypothetical protein